MSAGGREWHEQPARLPRHPSGGPELLPGLRLQANLGPCLSAAAFISNLCRGWLPAVQGTLPSLTLYPPLPPRLPHPCSGPKILSVKATSSDSGVACLEPPTQGGPWTKFACAACFGGSCVQAPVCSIDPTRRGLLAQACDAGTPCTLSKLESSTSYT